MQNNSNPKEYCACSEEIKARILEASRGDDRYINPSEVKFESEGIIFSRDCGPSFQPYLNAVVHHENKNGKPKKTKVNMLFTYCPFCGQKWREDWEVNNG